MVADLAVIRVDDVHLRERVENLLAQPDKYMTMVD
jgi:hypothetical protein